MAVRVPSCVLSGRARPGAAGRGGQPVGAESLNARQGMPFRHAPPWGGAPPRSAPHTPASHGLCACPPSRPPCPARPSPRRARGSGGRARTRTGRHAIGRPQRAGGRPCAALGGCAGGFAGGSAGGFARCRACTELAPSFYRACAANFRRELAPSLHRAWPAARPWSADITLPRNIRAHGRRRTLQGAIATL